MSNSSAFDAIQNFAADLWFQLNTYKSGDTAQLPAIFQTIQQLARYPGGIDTLMGPEKWQPLFYAIEYAPKDKAFEDIAIHLIDLGADINLRNKAPAHFGESPLRRAFMQEQDAIAEKLILKGAKTEDMLEHFVFYKSAKHVKMILKSPNTISKAHLAAANMFTGRDSEMEKLLQPANRKAIVNAITEDIQLNHIPQRSKQKLVLRRK